MRAGPHKGDSLRLLFNNASSALKCCYLRLLTAAQQHLRLCRPRYHIVQAEYNESTGGYKAVVNDDHIKKGDVINLNEVDPSMLKKLPWLKEPKEAEF